MRDGRIVYDGDPIPDHAVHEPWLGETHAHHHHTHDADARRRRDHAPHVRSPLEPR